MIVVDNGMSVNFIDENDIFLGFSLEGQCCEQYGWYISNKSRPFADDDYEKHLADCLYVKDKTCLEGYTFKPKSFKLANSSAYAKIRHPTKPDLLVVVFNEHNGYYSHSYLFGEAESNTFVQAENGNLNYKIDSAQSDGTWISYSISPEPKRIIDEGCL